MSIKDIAKSYLADQPGPWLKLVTELCRDLADWGNIALDPGEGSLSEDDFADNLLPELLSPTLAIKVSKSSTASDAEKLIARTINDFVKNMDINYRDDVIEYGYDHADVLVPSDDYDDYFDIRQTYSHTDDEEDEEITQMVSERDDPEDDEWDEYEVPRTQLVYKKTSLEEAVVSFFEESNIARFIEESNQNLAHSAFRLDIVDIALYQALMKHPDLLRSLNWRTFEKLLADVLESFGYEIELQRGTKDGGVDLFALKKTDTFGPQRFLLQAKRWANKVGIEPVRQLAFLHSHLRVTKSCLATTATFTQGAWELAHHYRWQLELRDFAGIHEWINQAARIKAKF